MRRAIIASLALGVVCTGIGLAFPIINGDFSAGGTGWTVSQQGDGTVAFPPEYLDVVGDDNYEVESYNGAYQTITPPMSVDLSFDLLYYTSSDSEWYDIPYLSINGSIYCLNVDGTIDWDTYNVTGTWTGGDAVNDVNNDNQVSTPLSFFAADIGGPGSVDIGLGVYTVDGYNGAGSAGFDNVVVPEPGVGVLMGLGIAGLVLYRRKRK